MSDEILNGPHSDLPQDLAAPARRALAAAGIQRLDQVAALSEEAIKRLHGIGPRALDQLGQAMLAQGLSFAQQQNGERT
jgi:hypothetical protein